MTLLEKVYSIFGIAFAVGLITSLVMIQETRQPALLLPLSFLGLLINVGLMFVVFKDIFHRWQFDRNRKILWTAALLLFWPAILVYLPLHGFRSRA